MVLKTTIVTVSMAYCALAASIYARNSGATHDDTTSTGLQRGDMRTTAPLTGHHSSIDIRSVNETTTASTNSTSNSTTARTLAVSNYDLRQIGALNTKDYQLYLSKTLEIFY